LKVLPDGAEDEMGVTGRSLAADSAVGRVSVKRLLWQNDASGANEGREKGVV
jgi:hypothetical protein